MSNFLSPLEFDFTIKRLPNVSFFVQGASVPGLSLGVVEQPTPFKPIMRHGDRLEYDELTVTMKVDSDMENWQEVVSWMKGLAAPASFDQYKELSESDLGVYSDASLYIMSNVKNPKIEITFEDLFPINIGPLIMDTRVPDLEFVTADVTFKFTSMKIKT